MAVISKAAFKKSLEKLGAQPDLFEGKALKLEYLCQIYEVEQDQVLDAIENKKLKAHYNYSDDCIWVDALDAAHFYFCLDNQPNANGALSA